MPKQPNPVVKKVKVEMSCGCVFKDINVKCPDKKCEVCVKKVKSVKAWAIIVNGKLTLDNCYDTRNSAIKDIPFFDKERNPKLVRVIIKEINVMTKNSEIEPLAPCPFCGSEPYIEERQGSYDGPGGFFVECSKWGCCVSQGGQTKDMAIKRWNTHQERSGLRVESVDEMVKDLKQWDEHGGWEEMAKQVIFLTRSPQGLKPLSEELDNYKHKLLSKIPNQITIPAFGKPPETVEYSEWRYWQGRQETLIDLLAITSKFAVPNEGLNVKELVNEAFHACRSHQSYLSTPDYHVARAERALEKLLSALENKR